MKIEEAIKWMEESVQNVRDFLEQLHPVQVSPTLQEKLTKQNEVFEFAITALRSMPKGADTNVGGRGWISVKDRMPDEHDSMFARFYGTEKWSGAMFKTCSDLVVVSYNANGQNLISTAITRDGKFRLQTVLAGEVTHWMPLPEPPKED